MGIRVVVVDDNPHVSWEGRVHPVNATFHRFLSAVLDVPGPDGSPAVDAIVHCVPLRAATVAPATLALDPRLEVVGTAPFEGIAGYLRHAPTMLRRNGGILRSALRGSDLAWLKVPASNAPLAACLARAAGVPRFGYVAGRAAEVAAAQDRTGLGRLAAVFVGSAYDGLGRLASVGGDRVVVGERLADGGIVTSLVADAEIRSVDGLPWPTASGELRIAWAGRVADGKGLEDLLRAVALVAKRSPGGPDVHLSLLGDGPARPRLERLATDLGIGQRLEWRGYIADRGAYLAGLRGADLFVYPSRAEGFPKVVLDAMAVGLPVLAQPAGSLRDLVDPGLIEAYDGGAGALARAIERLAADRGRAQALRRSGSAFAADHTAAAEAARLVARWRTRFAGLPWG
jgi:glycosyltransferase involved in cell wall biosynthesis